MAFLGLIFNALVWGLSWWPFRQFQSAGLHPLWATVGFFTLSWLVILVLRRQAWRELLGTPSLWLIMGAAGTTNTFFNWGVATGDVVRVERDDTQARVVEIVSSGDEMDRQDARVRWRDYAARGFSIVRHDLNLKG